MTSETPSKAHFLLNFLLMPIPEGSHTGKKVPGPQDPECPDLPASNHRAQAQYPDGLAWF